MTTLSGAFSLALLALLGAQSVSAQGSSNVVCLSTFDWASNSLGQNPCLVGAWLQTECNTGTFSVNSIPEGYHYIGPTNETSTQNPCICTSIVYNLLSACGACQNRTWISWESWSLDCPASILSAEGVYTQVIPTQTFVPHWAYLIPDNSDGFFNITDARLAGDTPESSVAASSTVSGTGTSSLLVTTTPGNGGGVRTITVTSSKSSGAPTGGSGGKSSSNTGAIAGGVVGGVLGLALVSLLGFLLLRNKGGSKGTERGLGAAGVNTGAFIEPKSPMDGPAPYVHDQSTGFTSQTAATPGYATSPTTYATHLPPQATGTPSQFTGAYLPPQGPPPPGGYSGIPENPHQQPGYGGYSGVPEV